MKTAVLFGAAALSCVPCVAAVQSADERLRAIYTEEWKWRLEQFPGLEGVEKPVPDRLPRVDPATQEKRLRYWQDVLNKLDDVPRAQLSPEEQINYDVYRPEIENFVADQKFRDYEMPANSDSAFWSDLGETARRPFKTLTDYKNWIAQLRDVPRYFRDQIANMRAGLARGFGFQCSERFLGGDDDGFQDLRVRLPLGLLESLLVDFRPVLKEHPHTIGESAIDRE